MKFTDIFIQRPVLALVVSIFILLLGVRAGFQLPVRQFPFLEESRIKVVTNYPGASAHTVQGFVTTPLQQKIAGAQGVEYITSESAPGISTINVHVRLGFNTSNALTEVIAKVNEARGDLPRGVEAPVVTAGSLSDALMNIAFFSDQHSAEQISDYVIRVVQPEIAAVEGVGEAELVGAKIYAMRIWLDPVRMAAFNVTAEDVYEAISRDNYISSTGATKGELVVTSVRAETDISDPKDFEEIVVRREGDKQVKIRDIAELELASENSESFVTSSGKESNLLVVTQAPGANPLTVADDIHAMIPELRRRLPQGMTLSIVHDASTYVQEAIKQVMEALFEASLIVIFVMFLFLGSLRVMVIPIVVIPVSLVGALFLIYIAGFSINLLTLLALVLAIGLVVDDAIVVVENVHRFIEKKYSPLEAALKGARQVALPVISMTLTLAAVYAPIGFLGGLAGTLFLEFAFALAGAVIVSGIVALTLNPMMCALALTEHRKPSRLEDWLDVHFERVRLAYQHVLSLCLQRRGPVVLVCLAVTASLPFLLSITQRELAPTEDYGMIFVVADKPRYASLDYLNNFTAEYLDIYRSFSEFNQSWQINTNSMSIGGMGLVPWDERERTEAEIKYKLQEKLAGIGGIQAFGVLAPPLPGIASGLPVQFVVAATSDYKVVYEVAEEITRAAWQSGLFMFAKNSLSFDRPEIVVSIDRAKAANLGISMESIGNTLSILLGEVEVNRFSIEGRSYKVIPQVAKDFRLSKEWLERYYLRTSSGDLVALSTVVTLNRKVEPKVLTQYQQLNSATVQGMLKPGVSMEDALDFLSRKMNDIAPPGFRIGFEGESRKYIQESSSLAALFSLSLMMIFLLLSIQFNSFRCPLVILISVPMSVFGAVLFLALDFGTLNIYTQVGLVTLIGLIAKHGILIVEFANQLSREGMLYKQAILEAATLRLRPILMTTTATVLGVLPLLYAVGAGANSRFSIGLVIASGMLVGTLFTLFVVPIFYTLLMSERTEKVV